MYVEQRDAKQIADDCAELLQRQFGATEVIPFGSVQNSTSWHSESDLDLAVAGLEPSQFFMAWATLQSQMEGPLKIDLVDLNSVQPEMYSRIRAEEVMSRDSLDELHSLVDDEVALLRRVVDETNQGMAQIDEFPPSHFEMNALASYVHQFYTGSERILERIARKIDGDVAGGAYSHGALLTQMTQAVYGVRPALFDEALKLRLHMLLQFRHFFRHSYGYILEWPKLKPLIEDMVPLLDDFEHQLFLFFMDLKRNTEHV